MFGQEFLQNAGIVPIPAQDFDDAAVRSLFIDLKNYGHATLLLIAGDTVGATMAVTLKEAKDVSGTGNQTLAFTKYFSNGQKLLIGTQTGTFTVGETITGATSNLTAYVYSTSRDFLYVIPLTGGTTWTDGETITGGTSGATAVLSGTGQDEDIMLDRTCASTFTIPAVTYKTFAIEVDADSLTIENGYHCVQARIADPGAASLCAGVWILTQPRKRGVPMPSTIDTKKMISTSTA